MSLMDPHFPFSPKKLKFNYCFIILPIAILGMLASSPGQTIGVSVFTDPLISVSNLSRLELSMSYFLGTFISSLFLKKVGPIYDKYGGRMLIFFSCLGLSGVLLHFGLLKESFSFIRLVSYFDHFIINMLIMTISFFLLRFLGQGIIMLTSRNLIGKWFYKKRGLMSAISGLSISVGFSNIPVLFGYLIAVAQWNHAYKMISFCLLIISFILWVFYRDNPEECGLFVDGQRQSIQSSIDDKNVPVIHSVEYKDAKQTVTFWVITLGLSLHTLAITAISFDLVDLARISNISKEVAIGMFFPIAIVAGIVDLLTGWMADKYPIKWTLMFMMVGASFGYSSANFLNTNFGYILSVIGIGVTSGCFGTLSNIALPHFFGTKFLNEISSYFVSYLVFATSLGPMLFAISNILFESYGPSLYLCSLIAIVLAVFSTKVEKIKAQ